MASTTLMLGTIPDGPETVLRRFQRLVSLDQQQEEDSAEECRREWMIRLSTLRESLHEKEVSFERLNARYNKLLKEVESQETELQRLRDWKVRLSLVLFMGYFWKVY